MKQRKLTPITDEARAILRGKQKAPEASPADNLNAAAVNLNAAPPSLDLLNSVALFRGAFGLRHCADAARSFKPDSITGARRDGIRLRICGPSRVRRMCCSTRQGF